MKKMKMGIVFGLCALTLTSLASCGDITAKDDLVLTYKFTTSSGDVKEAEINAQDVYERYLKTNPKDHAKAYYDTIYDVAVRLSFQEGGVLNKYQNEITSSTKLAITNLKNDADKNDQSWSDYLATLSYYDDSKSDKENERMLYLEKELEYMKKKVTKEFDEQFNEWKIDTESENYSNQALYNQLWGNEGYLNVNMPYAVRHLLVKAGDSSDNFTKSKISSTQATKLHRVFSRLLESNTDTNTFGIITHDESEDTGSVDRNGVYVMGTKTGFVNEFKLGIYAYESIINTQKAANYENFLNTKGDSFIGLGGSKESRDTVKSIGANYIPYEAIDKLYEYRDLEDVNGKKVNEGNEEYFPRNILFNKYFNVHNVSFIVNNHIAAENPTTAGGFINSDSGTAIHSDLDSNGKYKLGAADYITDPSAKSHFKTIAGLEHPVLCDEKGNPIMLVVNATSSGGIHLITIEKDYFDFVDINGKTTKKVTVNDSRAKNGSYEVSINEYYAPKSPIYQEGFNSSTGLPYYNVDNGSYKGEFPQFETTDGTYLPKSTFINNDVYTTPAKYESLVSSTITSEVTSNSYVSETSIKSANEFAWLVGETSVEVKNETAKNLVQAYQNNLKNTAAQSNMESLNSSWEQYATTLENQDRSRKYGLIPETCALRFKDAETDPAFQKGGYCYYSTSIK